MRRTVAVVCIALGVFSLVLAPLLRFWVAGAAMKAPLDQYSETVNRGDDVTYFSAQDLEQVDHATVEAYTTVRGDVAASDADIAVWDQFTWVKDVDEDFAFLSTSRRAGHDRVTGEAVDCCDASVNEEPVKQKGQAFKFPFLTEKKDYEFFDTATRQTLPIRFEGEETLDVDGEQIDTYKFVQVVEPTKIEERTLPKSLLDMDGDGDATADVMYNVTRTYWIEPTTGAPIDLLESQHRGAFVDGEERLVMFDGDMRFTDETIKSNVETAAEGASLIPLVRTTIPLVLLVTGVALVALGGILLATARTAAHGKR
ncbi:hypothetical protein HNR23_000253 [Nocardiopsis mwathae]|uniref:DUF3068 domain-containing protein n=1 Tax=Nocardiopsis mwathae TaxID=1472723 RepID=A0A7X0D3H5_9ACTN|nr:DUF3068 domain-containing protein [Nocardiopsis mwathae]MBB6170193.1 hypothetical protein [Nocardiopsis mwathae]